MFRILATCCLAAFALAGVAHAHFVFVVPDKTGATAQVVFSDDLSPDENVSVAKIASTKLHVRSGEGKPAALSWTKGDHAYNLKVPGEGARIVQGKTDYGVMEKKGDKAYLLRYHPRAVIGSPKADMLKPDATLSVEIIPVAESGKLRFLVAVAGKPLADAEVNVMLPGDKKQKAKTDAKGFTESFDAAGRYGAWVRHFETKAGELDGKKYEQIRNYATLVYDLSDKK